MKGWVWSKTLNSPSGRVENVAAGCSLCISRCLPACFQALGSAGFSSLMLFSPFQMFACHGTLSSYSFKQKCRYVNIVIMLLFNLVTLERTL